MMFQTSGLNTGKVRLETLITGFCCACAGDDAIPPAVIARATVSAAMTRRDNLSMDSSPSWLFKLWSCWSLGLNASATLLCFHLRANNRSRVAGGRDAAHRCARWNAALLRRSRKRHTGDLHT